MRTRKIKIGAIGVLAVVGAISSAYQVIRHNAERAQSGSIARIVRQSTNLYQKIAATPEPASVSTMQTVMYNLAGQSIPIVVVQIGPERSDSGLVLKWNGDTSELIEAEHSGIEELGAEFPILSRERAARISAAWLRALGSSSLSPQWKLSAAPQHQERRTVQGVYTANWVSPDQVVDVMIQHRTGDLLKIDIRKLPPHQHRVTLNAPAL